MSKNELLTLIAHRNRTFKNDNNQRFSQSTILILYTSYESHIVHAQLKSIAKKKVQALYCDGETWNTAKAVNEVSCIM